MKIKRFAVVMENVSGKLSKVILMDRVAGKVANAYSVTSATLRDGSAKAKLAELLGMAAYLNLRAA